MHHISSDHRGKMPQADISPECRSADDYADTVRHCLRNRLTVPRPRNAEERKILAATFAEVARSMGVAE